MEREDNGERGLWTIWFLSPLGLVYKLMENWMEQIPRERISRTKEGRSERDKGFFYSVTLRIQDQDLKWHQLHFVSLVRCTFQSRNALLTPPPFCHQLLSLLLVWTRERNVRYCDVRTLPCLEPSMEGIDQNLALWYHPRMRQKSTWNSIRLNCY